MKQIYHFNITLMDTQPDIWRTIQVSENDSFGIYTWRFKMPWVARLSHMNLILLIVRKQKLNTLAYPDEEFGDASILLGWEVRIKTYFEKAGTIARYTYDFGDGWEL